MWHDIITIAGATIKESRRDKFFVGIGLLLICAPLFGLFLEQLSLFGAEGMRATGTVSIFSLLAAAISCVFVGVSLRREVEGGVARMLMIKPAGKGGYILGKYLGFLAVFAVYAAVGALFAGLTGGLGVRSMLILAAAVVMKHGVMIAVTELFALMIGSTAFTIVGSIIAYGVFHAVDPMARLGAGMESAFGTGLEVLGWVLPAFDRFNVEQAVLYRAPIAGADWAGMVAEFAVYSLLALAVCWLDMRKKAL